MRRLPGQKTVEIRPLSGHMDVDSPDGAVGFYNLRLALNVVTDSERTRCRLGGFRKFGGDSPSGFKNQDYHDQLLDCLWYRQQFEWDQVEGGEASGYAYPGYQPDYMSGENPDGPFCGYASDFYPTYPSSATPGQWFICESFIGAPYTPQESHIGGGAPLSYSNWALATSVGAGGILLWNRPHVADGLAYLDSLEAIYGPSAQLDDARHFLNNIYVPATYRTTSAQGSFSGTYGTISYTYLLEYDAESASWYTEYDFNGAGGGAPLFYPVCNTGAPDYYQGSYYSLCFYDEHGGYFYGNPLTVTTPIGRNTYTYCAGDYLYRDACREAITLIFPTASEEGARRLIIGTKSRLALLDEISGNYRILADGLGAWYDAGDNCQCAGVRFKAAQVGNILVFVNGVDPPLWWAHGQGAEGCAGWSADYVADLFALGVTDAAVVGAFNGFMFVGDTTENGIRLPFRLRWSDFNAPLSFLSPITGSQAGYVDFSQGERLQRVEPVGKQLRVYTTMGETKRIYLATYVGGDEVWHFDPIYTGPDGLHFENALVNCGDEHWYAGNTGLFWLGEYDRIPRRIEWLHKGAQAIYKGISSRWLQGWTGELAAFGAVNRERCDQFIGFYDSIRKAVWFSWPAAGEECANMSLRYNVKYAGAALVDVGITAGAVHCPDYSPTLRDWLQENGFCLPSDMLEPKEGLPYGMIAGPAPPLYVRNPTEDPDLPVHPDSVCARVGDQTVSGICRKCDGPSVLLVAMARDKTIKEYRDDIDYREWYSGGEIALNCPYTTPGIYTQEGYDSMLQGDAYDYGRREEKFIQEVHIEFDAQIQSTPSLLYCQVAVGAQPSCLIWHDTDPRDLSCQIDDVTDQEFVDADERQGYPARFHWHRRGRWIAWRFYWGGIGGSACFDALAQKIRLASGKWD